MLLARTASSQAGAVFRYIGKAAQYFECVSESGCNCCGRRPVLPDVRLAVIVVGGVLYSVTAVVAIRPCDRPPEQSAMLVLPAMLSLGLMATPDAPYPRSAHPTSGLHVISSSNRSPAELLCLDSLAGLLARQSPRIYRVADAGWQTDAADSYAAWLREMSMHGVSVNDSLLKSSVPVIVSEMTAAVAQVSFVLADGATRCAPIKSSSMRVGLDRTCLGASGLGAWTWTSPDSISAALTLYAAKDGLIVAADAKLAAALAAAGVQQYADVRSQSVHDVLQQPGVMGALSQRIYVFQDPSKSTFLGDYATFARAATLPFGAESEAQAALLAMRNASDSLGAAFGWGPENSYVSTTNGAGVYVHASDYCSNLAALSNAPLVPPAQKLGPTLRTPSAEGNHPPKATPRHTVAFVMTDGDNLQWVLGPWSTDERWWASTKRGNVSVGWTLSPALAQVAPPALSLITRSQTQSDELLAGPSGQGYIFPQTWPEAMRAPFAALTSAGMQRAGMRLVNVLGQDDDPPDSALLASLLDESVIDGALYYPWGGGYSALEGRMWRLGEKLVVSGRVSLWGNGTSGTTRTPNRPQTHAASIVT